MMMMNVDAAYTTLTSQVNNCVAAAALLSGIKDKSLMGCFNAPWGS